MRDGYFIALLYAVGAAAIVAAVLLVARPAWNQSAPPGPPSSGIPVTHLSGATTGSRCNRKRVTTGAVNAGAYVNVAVPWITPFVDTNYTVFCSVVDATSAAVGLDVNHIQAVAAGSVTVTVHNGAVGPLTGTLGCIGIHD